MSTVWLPLLPKGVQEIPGAQPVVRTVPELIPQSVIDAREDMKAGREMQQDVPLVTLEDFRDAGAYAFGTPTRFGNVSAQLKNQIDQLTSLWLTGALEGKPAGVFVATGSLHGGQETTILTLMAPLLHLGMILVGVPYSTPELFTTQGGGSPYGPGHVAGDNNQAPHRRTGSGDLPRSWPPSGGHWSETATHLTDKAWRMGRCGHTCMPLLCLPSQAARGIFKVGT